ncbi:MAG: DNA recombination protein RmuC [Vicingaceae bacterium]
MELSAILFLFVGLVLGSAIAFIVSKRYDNSKVLQETINQMQFESTNLLVAQKTAESKAEEIQHQYKQLKSDFQKVDEEKDRFSNELSALKVTKSNLEEKLGNQANELEKLQERFTKDFQLIANKILKQNSDDFSQAHQKELAQILNPLKEKIQTFEKKVDEKYQLNRDEQISLKEQIKQLTELNGELNEQAQNLTKALKADTKKQGNWGEVILSRILERSGLTKGAEYELQFSTKNEENKRIQPDVIIHLPEEKHLIIDAKVSLVAYERFVNEEKDPLREKHLKEHINSVKIHIKGLSEKNYQNAERINSPDFVLLFMPIEPAFSLAMQSDTDLYAYAWDKKVVIVSPSTLLATLRTIASIWQQEKQTRNSIEIAQRAGRLYDKFVGFVDDMSKIDRGLSSAQNAYDDAFNKLKSGRGNIIGRLEHLRVLGAESSKVIPEHLIEERDEEV